MCGGKTLKKKHDLANEWKNAEIESFMI